MNIQFMQINYFDGRLYNTFPNLSFNQSELKTGLDLFGSIGNSRISVKYRITLFATCMSVSNENKTSDSKRW